MKPSKNKNIRVVVLILILFGIGYAVDKSEKANNSANNSINSVNTQQEILKNIAQVPTKLIDASVGFLIANSAGQTARFGNDTGLECSVSWQMDSLDPNAKEAIKIESVKGNNQKASMTCYYLKELFVDSSKHNTEYTVVITENDPKNKTAEMLVYLKLVSLKSVSDTHQQYLTIKPSRVSIPTNLYSKIF